MLLNCKLSSIQKIFILVLFSFCLLNPMTLYADKSCKNIDLKWLSDHIFIPEKAKIVSKKKVSSLCEVILSVGGDPVSLYCGDDFVVAGQMIQNKEFITEKNLESLNEVFAKERERIAKEKMETEKKREAFFRKNYKKMDEYVSFTIGSKKAEKSIFVITDPDCSHCKHLLRDIKSASSDNKIFAKVIVYPILGSQSENMAYTAFCKEYKYDDYVKMNDEFQPAFCKKGFVFLAKEKNFFRDANLNLVPIVVSGKGDWFMEGSDFQKIKDMLDI